MKRRINYTGRKKITRDKVFIEIKPNDDGEKLFEAQIDLKGMELPDDALVYLEAYHRTDLERYSYGTVKNIPRTKRFDISHLGHIENLLFRILVVDKSGKDGLILAKADRIRPKQPNINL